MAAAASGHGGGEQIGSGAERGRQSVHFQLSGRMDTDGHQPLLLLQHEGGTGEQAKKTDSTTTGGSGVDHAYVALRECMNEYAKLLKSSVCEYVEDDVRLDMENKHYYFSCINYDAHDPNTMTFEEWDDFLFEIEQALEEKHHQRLERLVNSMNRHEAEIRKKWIELTWRVEQNMAMRQREENTKSKVQNAHKGE